MEAPQIDQFASSVPQSAEFGQLLIVEQSTTAPGIPQRSDSGSSQSKSFSRHPGYMSASRNESETRSFHSVASQPIEIIQQPPDIAVATVEFRQIHTGRAEDV
jgi:hypothetical protein